MKFLLLFGPPAVGKMTVGCELAKRTGMKLFHNHMTIELVLNLFDWNDPQFGKLNGEFRRRIFEEFAASGLPGMIFTFVWAFNLPSEKQYVDGITEIFEQQGSEIYYVELEADLQERLKRNKSGFRLSQKPSKRDVGHSERMLMQHEEEHQFNSNGDFYYQHNYLKINNTSLDPSEVAAQIVRAFSLEEPDMFSHES